MLLSIYEPSLVVQAIRYKLTKARLSGGKEKMGREDKGRKRRSVGLSKSCLFFLQRTILVGQGNR